MSPDLTDGRRYCGRNHHDPGPGARISAAPHRIGLPGRFTAAVLAALVLPSALAAQTVPPASQTTPRSIAPRQVPAAPGNIATAVPKDAAVNIPPEADAYTYLSGKIILDGGLPERAAGDQALIAEYEGRQIRAGDLYRLAARLQAAYRVSGQPFIRVEVPPQRLEDGQPARLILIEGFIEALRLDGVPERLRELVRGRLAPLVGKHKVDAGELERRLLLLSEVPGVQLQSALGEGTTTGGIVLVVEAMQDRVGAQLSIDNSLGGILGPNGAVSVFHNGTPWAAGASLFLFSSFDPTYRVPFGGAAPRRVFGAGTTTPLGRGGVQATLQWTGSITQPPREIILRSDFTRVSAGLSAPLTRTRSRTSSIRLDLNYQNETQSVPQFGGIELFEDRYLVAQPGIDGSVRSGDFFVTYQSAAAVGRRLGEGISSRSIATETYALVRSNVSVLYRDSSSGMVLKLFVAAQAVVAGGIPTAELIAFDGPAGLPAFNAGSATSDNGIVSRFSIAQPTPLFADKMLLTPSLILSLAKGWDETGSPFALRTAAAIGLGLRLEPVRSLGPFRPSLSAECAIRSTVPSIVNGTRCILSLGAAL